MNAHQNCASCAFFDKKSEAPAAEADPAEGLDKQPKGVCRKNAPSPDPMVHRAMWPMVYGDDWCGEWKSKNQEL